MKNTITLVAGVLLLATSCFAGPVKLDREQQKKLNTFFSNFSEANVPGFEIGTVTNQVMLDFALRHLYINQFKSLKPTDDGNSVIATSRQIDRTTTKYFGRKVQSHQKPSYAIACADGEGFYFSQVDSLTKIGARTYKATGTIYSASSGGTPDVHGTPADWKNSDEDVTAMEKFSAVIESDDNRYILLEYSLARIEAP